LLGGLYGIALGRIFFGESMFARESNASKVALAYLCQQLLAWQFTLIDCQFSTDHLLSLGAKPIDRDDFLYRLNQAFRETSRQTEAWPNKPTIDPLPAK